jgi:hypothetical protein
MSCRGFTWSPFGIAWADNNWPNVICLAGPQVAATFLPSDWVETLVVAAARTGQGTGVKLPLPSFSRRSMEEKSFYIRLDGLMASVCPEDGR